MWDEFSANIHRRQHAMGTPNRFHHGMSCPTGERVAHELGRAGNSANFVAPWDVTRHPAFCRWKSWFPFLIAGYLCHQSKKNMFNLAKISSLHLFTINFPLSFRRCRTKHRLMMRTLKSLYKRRHQRLQRRCYCWQFPAEMTRYTKHTNW